MAELLRPGPRGWGETGPTCYFMWVNSASVQGLLLICVQRSLLAGLEGHMGGLGVKPKLVACKRQELCAVVLAHHNSFLTCIVLLGYVE